MSVVVTVNGNTVQTKSGTVTPRLNGPSQGSIVVPMHLSEGEIGTAKGKIVIDGEIALHARCTEWELTAGEDTGYVTLGFTDPIELWEKRPARDDDGDFSKPSFIEDTLYGPQILEQILTNSETYEGDMEILLGTFATGGPSLEGAPVDWPMMISEIAALLVSTGELDVVAVPIDNGSDLIRIDAYNGNYGTDRTGDVILEYGMGAYNIAGLRWAKTMADVVNKLWYYLGPRVLTDADPAGDQHWKANITGDDTGLSDPPKSTVIARRDQSRTDYLVRMMIQIFDGTGDEAIVARDLYRWQWLAEQYARAIPRDLVHITPQRGAITYGDFGVGDLITVRATSEAAGGFSGAQRVYEYTVSWDEDSVLAVSELQTSAGNEGFTT